MLHFWGVSRELRNLPSIIGLMQMIDNDIEARRASKETKRFKLFQCRRSEERRARQVPATPHPSLLSSLPASAPCHRTVSASRGDGISMASPKLRVGYVPEHFSSPLLQLAASDDSIELVPCP